MDETVLSDLIIKKVYSVSNIYKESEKKAKRCDRPCWGIVLRYEGETVYENGGKYYPSNMQNMVILPKGCTYEWQCVKSGRFFILEFECDATAETIFHFPITCGDKILQLFREAEYKRAKKSAVYKLEIVKIAYSILLMLLQSRQPKYLPSDKREKIAPALDYIVQHYGENLKNEELAERTGLSTVYFRKLFTEIYGVSPIRYIHRLRIKKAKEMLQSDYGSFTEIALSLGYSDIYDFSRTFKKYTGFSPSAYLKRQRERT